MKAVASSRETYDHQAYVDREVTMPRVNPIQVQFPIKFLRDQHVVHKNGDRYQITHTPVTMLIEETGEPAYGYRKYDTLKNECVGPIFVRSQTKMEDGRFKKVDSSYGALYGGETGYW